MKLYLKNKHNKNKYKKIGNSSDNYHFYWIEANCIWLSEIRSEPEIKLDFRSKYILHIHNDLKISKHKFNNFVKIISQ